MKKAVGFGSYDEATRRAIARKGGRAAQASGKAHRWGSDEGKAARERRRVNEEARKAS